MDSRGRGDAEQRRTNQAAERVVNLWRRAGPPTVVRSDDRCRDPRKYSRGQLSPVRAARWAPIGIFSVGIQAAHQGVFKVTADSGDIPAISTGAERVATGVATALFAEDYERTFRRMVGWSNPELRGDEYVLDEDVSPFLAEQPADLKT